MVTMTLGEALAIALYCMDNVDVIFSPAEVAVQERARAVIAEHYDRLLDKFEC